MQSSISCMWNLFVMSRRFAWISFAEARTFSRFFQRALGDLHFSTLSTNNKRNQRKSWRVNFHDHHRCASRSHNETKLKRFGITATTAIGWGQEEGMDEDTAMWKEGVRVIIYGSPERQKKMLFERLFSRNKKINALTEVKENQYLTASGIKFFKKQTAGNNCPGCMTDRLNVRLRSTEIIFAWLKEGKPPIPFFES